MCQLKKIYFLVLIFVALYSKSEIILTINYASAKKTKQLKYKNIEEAQNYLEQLKQDKIKQELQKQ